MAIYTDSGTKFVEALDTTDFWGALVDGYFIAEKMTKCPVPVSWQTGMGTGDYVFASSAVLKPPKEGEKVTRTWLARDQWAKGPEDPGGNNNGHGEGKFYFVSNDMNSTGDAGDYAVLMKEETEKE